jgi:hypothetical protein
MIVLAYKVFFLRDELVFIIIAQKKEELYFHQVRADIQKKGTVVNRKKSRRKKIVPQVAKTNNSSN